VSISTTENYPQLEKQETAMPVLVDDIARENFARRWREEHATPSGCADNPQMRPSTPPFAPHPIRIIAAWEHEHANDDRKDGFAGHLGVYTRD
jgi:hypothetical protein